MPWILEAYTLLSLECFNAFWDGVHAKSYADQITVTPVSSFQPTQQHDK